MSSTVLLLNTVRNTFLYSITIPFILFGTVGNLLNIILFKKTTLWTLSPCSPFLLAASIANIVDIYANILMRMLVGFKINPTFYSSAVCKLQLYFYYTSFCLSSWFIVGCCADRFFSSSRHAVIRQYSNKRMTNWVILTITIIILIGYLQVFYCYDANQLTKPAPCYVQNDVCSIVDTIYAFVFQSIGPPLFMLIFGIGTFLNIHTKVQIRPELQITRETGKGTALSFAARRVKIARNRDVLLMVTIQVILYLLCSLPFFAMKIYQNLASSTVKTDVRISIENLILNVTSMITFVDKVFSFYIYTLSSKYYRKELIKLFTRCYTRTRTRPLN